MSHMPRDKVSQDSLISSIQIPLIHSTSLIKPRDQVVNMINDQDEKRDDIIHQQPRDKHKTDSFHLLLNEGLMPRDKHNSTSLIKPKDQPVSMINDQDEHGNDIIHQQPRDRHEPYSFHLPLNEYLMPQDKNNSFN